MVFEHRQDRALVDAEMVARHPADAGMDSAAAALEVGEGEARVERILEAIILIRAGMVTSGANGIDPPAAVGTIVPSSTTRAELTPRAE